MGMFVTRRTIGVGCEPARLGVILWLLHWVRGGRPAGRPGAGRGPAGGQPARVALFGPRTGPISSWRNWRALPFATERAGPSCAPVRPPARPQAVPRSPGLPGRVPPPATCPAPSRLELCARSAAASSQQRGSKRRLPGKSPFSGSDFPSSPSSLPDSRARTPWQGSGGGNESEKKFGRIRPASPVRSLALALR